MWVSFQNISWAKWAATAKFIYLSDCSFGSSASFSISRWSSWRGSLANILSAGTYHVRWRSSLTTRPSQEEGSLCVQSDMSLISCVFKCHKTERTNMHTFWQDKKAIVFKILSRFDFILSRSITYHKIISMILQRLFHFHIHVKFFHLPSTKTLGSPSKGLKNIE